ncbi:hypothetical protein [Azorhizobium doebereinerae]|uniref:hypothetical protein n=1 Tax=Azorhizobium doebereinerae TaxID=281091 RepID=UPI001AEC33EF|nr:hypothetical protein [Azorhizobium doebereinerae]
MSPDVGGTRSGLGSCEVYLLCREYARIRSMSAEDRAALRALVAAVRDCARPKRL